jgi:hypothetical protein
MTTVLMTALLVSTGSVTGRAPNLALELAPPSGQSAAAVSLVFRASGSHDIYFKSGSVHLEIRDSRGSALRYACADKRDILADTAPVRLRPGESISRTLDVRCYHPTAKAKYTVVAVFEDRGDDFRGEAPAGAVWVTGPIRSNSIVTSFGDAHNTPLQADGAARRR